MKEGIKPGAGDVDMWIKMWEIHRSKKLVMRTCGSKFWEELHLLRSKEILVEVEHVKAHRTKKEEKDMSHFENLVTEGNEKADELAKPGAMLDEGFMSEMRGKTLQGVYTALQYAASFHYLVEEWKDSEKLKPKPQGKWVFVDEKREETGH